MLNLNKENVKKKKKYFIFINLVGKCYKLKLKERKFKKILWHFMVNYWYFYRKFSKQYSFKIDF